MAANPELKQKVEELLQENEVLLFMKGTPEMPRCGFSMRVVGVLEQLGVEYGAVDVLPVLDPLREVTGEISDWRTFPPALCQRRAGRGLRHRRGDARDRRAVPAARRRAARGGARRLRSHSPPTRSRARRLSWADQPSVPRVGSDGRGALGCVLAHLEGRATAACGDDVRVVRPRTRRPEGRRRSRPPEPNTNCMLTLSTTTETPGWSKTWSSSLGWSSARAYWNPEQPPPRTDTRSACSGEFSFAASRSLILPAALSVRLTARLRSLHRFKLYRRSRSATRICGPGTG